MKFNQTEPGMTLFANNGSSLYYIMFVVKKTAKVITIDKVALTKNSRYCSLSTDRVSRKDWDDAFMIYFDSKIATEEWRRIFIRGAFGVPLSMK